MDTTWTTGPTTRIEDGIARFVAWYRVALTEPETAASVLSVGLPTGLAPGASDIATSNSGRENEHWMT